jgi:hypothetical protein
MLKVALNELKVSARFKLLLSEVKQEAVDVSEQRAPLR